MTYDSLMRTLKVSNIYTQLSVPSQIYGYFWEIRFS